MANIHQKNDMCKYFFLLKNLLYWIIIGIFGHMKLIKKLYRLLRGSDFNHYKWEVIEADYSDMVISFTDGKLIYDIDLDWEDGIIDVEFSVRGAKYHDTTNLHNQYRILTTVAYATRRVTDNISNNTGYEFHSVTFRGSDFRNGEVDKRSGDIRNRFFLRYIYRQFPNAEVVSVENNVITVNLNRA